MPRNELTSRWKKSPGNDLRSERIPILFEHGGVLHVDHTPFGRVDGDLMDFRGYPARQLLVRNVVIKDADFSFADFSSAWMMTNRYENCFFVKTDFRDFAEHGNSFDHCKFLNCKFSDAVLGYAGSTYNDCYFHKCSFSRTNFIRAEFTNTDFVNCRLTGLDFNGSSFQNCKFEGLLEDVWFRGTFPHQSLSEEFGEPRHNRMLNVSFENADLIDPTFSDGCDLSTVKLKSNGRYVKYDNWFKRIQFLEKETEACEDKFQKNEIIRYVKVAKVHAQKQDWEIVSMNDLESNYGGVVVARRITDTLDAYNPE